jgi:hypothetical protein
VVTGQNPFADSVLSGADGVQRPDVVPGVPFYLYPLSAPGGKVINPAAFTTPVTATAQGDLGRNALRGFGATQWDMTVRRQFRLTERIALQARGDFFNILNHPNFGSPINYLSSPQFGQSTQTLNNWRWRPERRPQSSLSNWRTAIDPACTQTSVLNIRLHDARSAGAVSRLLRCDWSGGYPSR